jgi:hypothetical protein
VLAGGAKRTGNFAIRFRSQEKSEEKFIPVLGEHSFSKQSRITSYVQRGYSHYIVLLDFMFGLYLVLGKRSTF